MKTRSEFALELAKLKLSHIERAIAFLWYYRQSQEFDDRTASELANDLQDEGFPRPNASRLKNELTRSRRTVRGRRHTSFTIDVRYVSELDDAYSDILELRKVEVADAILPADSVAGTRTYLEKLVHQINGSYQFGFYDACAVLCRRLMESLIIEVYVNKKRQHEIQLNGVFRPLEWLIAFIKNDTNIALTRGNAKNMDEVKMIGDSAAHNRFYITRLTDIDDIKANYRRLIAQLLTEAGI